MAPSNQDHLANLAQRPSRPVNLTAASEPMSWEQACKSIGVSGPGAATALDVHGVDHAEMVT